MIDNKPPRIGDTQISELPSFVKDIRAPGSPFPAVHYWIPDPRATPRPTTGAAGNTSGRR